jgi:hypothetical protein
MPDAPDHPIAYTALEPGTPVQTSDGHTFAMVQAVLVDERVSVFDGIVVQTAEGIRFVDADHVGTISTTRVCPTLSRGPKGTSNEHDAAPAVGPVGRHRSPWAVDRHCRRPARHGLSRPASGVSRSSRVQGSMECTSTAAPPSTRISPSSPGRVEPAHGERREGAIPAWLGLDWDEDDSTDAWRSVRRCGAEPTLPNARHQDPANTLAGRPR